MTESTDVTYNPRSGELMQADAAELGRPIDDDDFAAAWFAPENADTVQDEINATEGLPQVGDQEKAKMAARHEPFNVLSVDTVMTQYGERWKLEIETEDGTEKIMLLSVHPQRNRAIELIRDRIMATQTEVKNVMLQFAFESQGSPFYVLRPWDGRIVNV